MRRSALESFSQTDLRLVGQTSQTLLYQTEAQRVNLQLVQTRVQLESVSKQLADCEARSKQLKDRYLKEKHDWSLERSRLTLRTREVLFVCSTSGN